MSMFILLLTTGGLSLQNLLVRSVAVITIPTLLVDEGGVSIRDFVEDLFGALIIDESTFNFVFVRMESYCKASISILNFDFISILFNTENLIVVFNTEIGFDFVSHLSLLLIVFSHLKLNFTIINIIVGEA
jgi:hypothetical protein